MKSEDLVRVFTETFVRTLLGNDVPKGPDLAQVAAVVDRRLESLLNQEPPTVPSAGELDAAFSTGWQDPQKQPGLFDGEDMASKQQPYKAQYRPDGDYPPGTQDTPMTPWVS